MQCFILDRNKSTNQHLRGWLVSIHPYNGTRMRLVSKPDIGDEKAGAFKGYMHTNKRGDGSLGLSDATTGFSHPDLSHACAMSSHRDSGDTRLRSLPLPYPSFSESIARGPGNKSAPVFFHVPRAETSREVN